MTPSMTKEEEEEAKDKDEEGTLSTDNNEPATPLSPLEELFDSLTFSLLEVTI